MFGERLVESHEVNAVAPEFVPAVAFANMYGEVARPEPESEAPERETEIEEVVMPATESEPETGWVVSILKATSPPFALTHGEFAPCSSIAMTRQYQLPSASEDVAEYVAAPTGARFETKSTEGEAKFESLSIWIWYCT
jgi:hypothetical protein